MLGDRQQKVMAGYIAGYKYLEISRSLNMPEGTVSSDLRRAKRVLRKRMAKLLNMKEEEIGPYLVEILKMSPEYLSEIRAI